MSTADGTDDRPAEPDITPSRRFSWIWLAPVIAALIASWLVYSTIANRGQQITIMFDSATGLEAGRTPIKYKDVEIGRVEKIEVSADLGQIVVTARMVQGTESFLTSGAKFWIVRPRVGTGGVSGLDTLVSGAYVAFDPGDGEQAYQFHGLDEPPLVRADVPGKRFVLRAESLQGISRGSPVYHRGIEVGNVLGHELRNETNDLLIHIYVREPNDLLVTNKSRFWNASGIKATAAPDGLGLEVESFQALMTGGISFTNSGAESDLVFAREGDEFPLFEDFNEAQDAAFTRRIPLMLEFDGSIRGLVEGAPVELKGIKVGEVERISLVYDSDTGEITSPIKISLEPERFQILGDSIDIDGSPYAFADTLVARGLRAQLKTGSLLTGELLVSLEFTGDRSIQSLDQSKTVPVMPTVASDLDVLTASLSGVLTKLASLPLETIVDEMRATVASARNLIESPDLRGSVQGLNRAMADLEGMIGDVRGEAGPLVSSLRRSADQAERTIRAATSLMTAAEGTVGPESQASYDLKQLMQELTSAARSVRVFADYLERHPEALLRGKQGGFN